MKAANDSHYGEKVTPQVINFHVETNGERFTRGLVQGFVFTSTLLLLVAIYAG